MEHLRALDSFRQLVDWNYLIISKEVHTPLSLTDWTLELSDHPDREFSKFILEGIANGFLIGFNRSQQLQPAATNLQRTKPQIVTEYLDREVALNRMWRCPTGYLPKGIHISPIGLIPKKNKPGKWRMIVDLSAPRGMNVNDGIDAELSSLSYATIDQLAALVVSEGKGAFLVKADIQEAYRMVPVHAEDQYLLGVHWDGTVYIDRVLPFGLRSAPKLFSVVADALQWILHKKGIEKRLHYLDDFILVAGSPHRAVHQKEIILKSFEKLKVPIEQSKLEGPSTCLSFLGIEIDMESMQLRLPSSKLSYLKEMLAECIQLEPTKANGLVAVCNQSSLPRETLSGEAVHTPGGRKPPRPLCAFKSGCQSRHYVVVCFLRKMEWHFIALGSGNVRSAASSIFRCIGIMGMCSSPGSSLASTEIDPQTSAFINCN